MLNVVVNFVDVQDGIHMVKKYAGEDVFKTKINFNENIINLIAKTNSYFVIF
jgi:hypothetical protein